MATDTDERRLGAKITVLARLFRRDFDRSAAEIGVTRAQWSTVAAVASREGATQREIAAMLDIGEVSAGRLIDKLSDDGWLERRRDPRDRRVFRIHLQPATASLLAQLRILGHAQEQRAFAGVTRDELSLLSDILDRAVENLRQEALFDPGAPDDLRPIKLGK